MSFSSPLEIDLNNIFALLMYPRRSCRQASLYILPIIFGLLHIGHLLKEHNKKYVRLQVKGGGCAGFEYEWSFEDEAEKEAYEWLFSQDVADDNRRQVHFETKDFFLEHASIH